MGPVLKSSWGVGVACAAFEVYVPQGMMLDSEPNVSFFQRYKIMIEDDTFSFHHHNANADFNSYTVGRPSYYTYTSY